MALLVFKRNMFDFGLICSMMCSGTISTKPMQFLQLFQTCKFSLILDIMSEIIITRLRWGSFSLLKLKKGTGGQRIPDLLRMFLERS